MGGAIVGLGGAEEVGLGAGWVGNAIGVGERVGLGGGGDGGTVGSVGGGAMVAGAPVAATSVDGASAPGSSCSDGGDALHPATVAVPASIPMMNWRRSTIGRSTLLPFRCKGLSSVICQVFRRVCGATYRVR